MSSEEDQPQFEAAEQDFEDISRRVGNKEIKPEKSTNTTEEVHEETSKNKPNNTISNNEQASSETEDLSQLIFSNGINPIPVKADPSGNSTPYLHRRNKTQEGRNQMSLFLQGHVEKYYQIAWMQFKFLYGKNNVAQGDLKEAIFMSGLLNLEDAHSIMKQWGYNEKDQPAGEL